MKKQERRLVVGIVVLAAISVLVVLARLEGWGPFGSRGPIDPGPGDRTGSAPIAIPEPEVGGPGPGPETPARESRPDPDPSIPKATDTEPRAAVPTEAEDGEAADEPPLPEGAVRVEVVRASDLEPVEGVPVSMGITMGGEAARMPIRSATTDARGRAILDASGISFQASPVEVEVDVRQVRRRRPMSNTLAASQPPASPAGPPAAHPQKPRRSPDSSVSTGSSVSSL